LLSELKSTTAWSLAQWAEKHNCMQRWMMHILS
jgi:hypothetical protein